MDGTICGRRENCVHNWNPTVFGTQVGALDLCDECGGFEAGCCKFLDSY